MKKPIKAISLCKLITVMLEKAYDYELTQPLQSKPIYQAKVMLITQQQVLGKTKNKRKMLKKELGKGSQLTYLLKVSQLISNSQRLKLVKKNRSFNSHWYSYPAFISRGFTLHKKISFPLWISLVNMNKSAVSKSLKKRRNASKDSR